MAKTLYWMVVYWRNKMFYRTKYHPHKLGLIVGMVDLPEMYNGELCRCGILKELGIE